MAVPAKGQAAEEALYASLQKVAEYAGNSSGVKESQSWAAAAKDLAEALAWLRVPGESHGGGGAAASS